MTQKSSVTVSGTVDKIITSLSSGEPEKAQLLIDGVDHSSQQIRLVNTLRDEKNDEVQLKADTEVRLAIRSQINDNQAKEQDQCAIRIDFKSRLPVAKEDSE